MSYQISLKYVAKWRYPDIPKSGGKKRIRIIIIIKDQGFSGTLDRSFHYYKSVTDTVLKIFQYSFTLDVCDSYIHKIVKLFTQTSLEDECPSTINNENNHIHWTI